MTATHTSWVCLNLSQAAPIAVADTIAACKATLPAICSTVVANLPPYICTQTVRQNVFTRLSAAVANSTAVVGIVAFLCSSNGYQSADVQGHPRAGQARRRLIGVSIFLSLFTVYCSSPTLCCSQSLFTIATRCTYCTSTALGTCCPRILRSRGTRGARTRKFRKASIHRSAEDIPGTGSEQASCTCSTPLNRTCSRSCYDDRSKVGSTCLGSLGHRRRRCNLGRTSCCRQYCRTERRWRPKNKSCTCSQATRLDEGIHHARKRLLKQRAGRARRCRK